MSDNFIKSSDNKTNLSSSKNISQASKSAEQRQEPPENLKKSLNVTEFWHDKQHKDLLFYLAVGIFMLELIVGVVAFFYGVMNATPGINGAPPRFQFPWLAYTISAVIAPTVLLLIVHLLGLGLFHSLKRNSVEDNVWRQDLPERLRKFYAIIHGAPTILLLISIVMLGVAVFFIDGAIQVLFSLGSALEGYLAWIIGSIVLTWCIVYITRIWFKYRVKRLEAEYSFRREIFESSGIIIVDKGSEKVQPTAIELSTHNILEAGQVKIVEIGAGSVHELEDKQNYPKDTGQNDNIHENTGKIVDFIGESIVIDSNVSDYKINNKS